MRLPPTNGAFVGALSSFGVLLALYGAELADWVRLQSAQVAALSRAPRPWLAVPVLLLAVGGAGLYAWALRARKPVSFPGYRLLPISLVVALFVDVLVLSSAAVPVSSPDQTAVALALLQRNLMSQTQGTVITEPARLRPLVKELGAPPYFVNGEPVEEWNLQVRTGCEGPVGEAPGVAPATLIYCVSKDRRIAWITVVSLPVEQRFGPPGMFGRNGNVQMVPVLDPRTFEEEAPEGSPGERAPPDEEVPFRRERGLTPPEGGR